MKYCEAGVLGKTFNNKQIAWVNSQNGLEEDWDGLSLGQLAD